MKTEIVNVQKYGVSGYSWVQVYNDGTAQRFRTDKLGCGSYRLENGNWVRLEFPTFPLPNTYTKTPVAR